MRVKPRRAVAPRQGGADVDPAVKAREGMPLRLVNAGDDAPGDAFLMIDAAQRLGRVGVAQADFARAQVFGAGDVLRARQLPETKVRRSRPEDVELPRRVV